MIKIEIESQDVRDLQGVSKVSGKPYHIRIQSAYAWIVGPDGKPAKYPQPFDFLLEAEQAPYPPGVYTLHPSALKVREGRLTLAAIALAPVKQGAAA